MEPVDSKESLMVSLVKKLVEIGAQRNLGLVFINTETPRISYSNVRACFNCYGSNGMIYRRIQFGKIDVGIIICRDCKAVTIYGLDNQGSISREEMEEFALYVKGLKTDFSK